MLDAALDAGFNLPHSCKTGNCGACRARLIEGEVRYPNGAPLGLTAAQAAQGLILLCEAHATSDLCIDTFEVAAADEALIKRLPSRIEGMEHLSHDVIALFLRLPPAESFDFKPGQYVDIMLSGGRRRSFSIASPPHASRPLELHVRRVPGGEFSEQLFTDAVSGTLLELQGPLGHFVYRPDEAPLLLVGGGTGLAPLMSILRHLTETGVRRPTALYWGVRGRRDLYAHDTLEDLARRIPSFRYVPVLSEPEAGWAGRRGWVHEAVIADVTDLDRYDVYVSGPPAMIDAARRDFGEHGVLSSRLSFDSFDYAPDSPARQRNSALTTS